jgi:hypothetical protein
VDGLLPKWVTLILNMAMASMGHILASSTLYLSLTVMPVRVCLLCAGWLSCAADAEPDQDSGGLQWRSSGSKRIRLKAGRTTEGEGAIWQHGIWVCHSSRMTRNTLLMVCQRNKGASNGRLNIGSILRPSDTVTGVLQAAGLTLLAQVPVLLSARTGTAAMLLFLHRGIHRATYVQVLQVLIHRDSSGLVAVACLLHSVCTAACCSMLAGRGAAGRNRWPVPGWHAVCEYSLHMTASLPKSVHMIHTVMRCCIARKWILLQCSGYSSAHATHMLALRVLKGRSRPWGHVQHLSTAAACCFLQVMFCSYAVALYYGAVRVSQVRSLKQLLFTAAISSPPQPLVCAARHSRLQDAQLPRPCCIYGLHRLSAKGCSPLFWLVLLTQCAKF